MYATLPIATLGTLVSIISFRLMSGHNEIRSPEDLIAHLKKTERVTDTWTFKAIWDRAYNARLHLKLVEYIEQSKGLLPWDRELQDAIKALRESAEQVRHDAIKCLYSKNCRALLRDYEKMVEFSHYTCTLLKPELAEQLERVL